MHFRALWFGNASAPIRRSNRNHRALDRSAGVEQAHTRPIPAGSATVFAVQAGRMTARAKHHHFHYSLTTSGAAAASETDAI
jgi:hypothetical protein